MHWQEALRGSGSFSPDLRLGCDPSWALPVGLAGLGKRLGPGEVAANLAAEGWAAAQQHLPCLQHPDEVLKTVFSSPLASLVLLPCVLLLLVFSSRAAALLLTLSLPVLGLPVAGLPWSCLSPSQALLLLQDLGPPSLALSQ